MRPSPAAERHLSSESFAEYLAADVPVVLPIAGDPSVTIFIDPVRRRIGLRSPIRTDAAVIPSRLENLQVSIVSEAGSRQLEVAASDPELFADVYPMLCAIADRIQLGHVEPLAALEETLDLWHRLLAQRSRLTQDQEVGLFGELVLLRALIDNWDPEAAGASWRGPLGEEHDFGFAQLDLEVKTTTAERRRHWFGNLTQLVATPPRQLWLLSVQITRAGAGHGQTLSEAIDSARGLLTDEVTLARLNEVLRSLHWSDDQRDLYLQRWTLRSQPRAFRVDAAFPALTPASLATLGLTSGEITQVGYEVDVTNRLFDEPPEPLRSALEHIE